MNVVVVNVGTKYPKDYTLRVFNMVKRNTTKDFKFFVYTDQPDTYPEDHINVIEHQGEDYGWWCKLSLFKEGVLPEGDWLYLDLDVVIVDNIDCFFDHPSFGVTRDFIRPINGILPGPEFNSSVLRFDTRETDGIFDYYSRNREHWLGFQKKVPFFGDQNVISAYVNHGFDDFLNIFPDEWISSFKKGVVRGGNAGDRSEWFGRVIDDGVKIVAFHGNPSPSDILDNREAHLQMGENFVTEDTIGWIEENWR